MNETIDFLSEWTLSFFATVICAHGKPSNLTDEGIVAREHDYSFPAALTS